MLEEKTVKTIKSIYIELSNICNYAQIHARCPLNGMMEKTAIKTTVVKKILDELSAVEYSGIINFHNYNEPMIDPRLFYITSYAKSICKKATIRILTNGFYLTQEIIDELKIYGIDRIDISLYSKQEKERLKKIQFNAIEYNFLDNCIHSLDDRLNIYTKNIKICTLPCYSLSKEIIVRYTGEVVLCCLDWKSKYIFGNLEFATLQDIFDKHDVIEIQNSLSRGNRILEICKRCDWQRGI